MTPCEQYRNQLDAWLDDELDSADAAALEKHLAACPACRDVFQSHGALAGRITELAELSNRIAVKTAGAD
ncbi:MAG: zf-HC2 domain-containing protein [Planctomycetes bacterium]|nr:zf-HC2 domain-containing protein [Planctomycetota bacterium]